MEEEEKLLNFIQIGEDASQIENLYLVNSYYLFKNLQKTEWKIDWKTIILLFTLVDKPLSIADLLKTWPFFRHYKDISPRLPPLLHFELIQEEAGAKNAKILQATTKGRYVVAFFFYIFAFDNEGFKKFSFLESQFHNLPGFNTVDDLFQSLKLIKSQVPALLEITPKIQAVLEELNWKIDSKLLLVPLYLLESEKQSYTDLIQNYPHFGYYRELKKRIIPLVSLNLVDEEKAGRKGSLLSLTRKGRMFLSLFAYLLGFPQQPSK